MSITFRRAVREEIGLIIGIAGPSGSGKTYSALRLATGLSGGKPFAFLDTEAGRARHYADTFTFDHADLHPPFRPSSYADAIKAADAAGYPVIVVDSCSHEHAGEGGLLDYHEEELDRMAGTDWKKRDNCNMAAWIKPKMEHKQMVQRLLQVRAHLILCFRAEQKVDMERGQDGRMHIVPKKIASGFSDWIPICEKNLLYELTASFLLTPDAPGVPKPIKLQEQLRQLMDLKRPLDETVGKQLAAWAKGSKGAAPAARVDGEQSADHDQGMTHDTAVDPPPPPYIANAKFPFDPHKGKPISDESITEQELDDCLWAMNKYVKDPKKAAYKARNEELAMALEAELDRRRGQGTL